MSKIKMKNIPKKLYLQIGEEDVPDDFNDLEGEYVTWSTTKCLKNDIRYVLDAQEVEDTELWNELKEKMNKWTDDEFDERSFDEFFDNLKNDYTLTKKN